MIRTKTHPIIITTAIASAALLSGCVTVTKFKDEDRTKIRFSSARAAEVFYDAALLPHDPNKHERGEVKAYVGIPFWITTKESQNIAFNKAVREADRNRDGIITESEADSFAKKIKSQNSSDA